jgi:hypothetical protein
MKLPINLSFLKPIKYNNLIRLGNDSDGGYILPGNLLKSIDGIISFGLNDDWTFEEAALNHINKKIDVHIYDHSVGLKTFLRMLFNNIFSIYGFVSLIFGGQKFKNTYNLIVTIFKYKIFFKKNVIHYQNRVYNRKDLDIDIEIEDIFKRQSNNKNILLKIDIEGGEYRILNQIINYQKVIPVITCEFHDIGPLRKTFEDNLKSILEFYYILHLHGNNYVGCSEDNTPDVLEITFINKNQIDYNVIYLNQVNNKDLDFPNNINKPDYILEF